MNPVDEQWWDIKAEKFHLVWLNSVDGRTGSGWTCMEIQGTGLGIEGGMLHHPLAGKLLGSRCGLESLKPVSPGISLEFSALDQE